MGLGMSDNIVQGASSIPSVESIKSMLGDMQLPGSEPVVEGAPAKEIPNVSAAAKAFTDDAFNLFDNSTVEEPISEPEEGSVEQVGDSTSAEELQVEEDIEAEEEKLTPAAENFKRLRESLKKERVAKRELEELLGTTKSSLERYEKGEHVPEIVRAKDERIAALEKYETIYALESSPYFQSHYVQPAIELRSKLDKLAVDYGVSKETLQAVVGVANKKEQNRLLSGYLGDIGGLEARKIIDDMDILGNKISEARKQPKEALDRLKELGAVEELEQKKVQASVFEAVAKTAWNTALEKTKTEGEYKEFIMHPTDAEYNKTVVEPIQHKAATQYGALVKQLADAGLKRLDPNLAVGLARMVQLSIAGALSLKDKAKVERQLNAVQQHNQRVTPYMRPAVGGNNGSSNGKNSSVNGRQGPRTAQEAALMGAAFFK